MRGEMNILAMAKGPERFIFLYDDPSYDTLLDVLDKFADDPGLDFSSDDAELLGRKAHESRIRTAGLRNLSDRPH